MKPRASAAVGAGIVFLAFLGATQARMLPSSGKWPGYLLADRWGQKVLCCGESHYFVSDEVFEQLNDKVGQPLVVHVSKMEQWINPGAGMIRAVTTAEAKPSVPGLEVSVACPRTMARGQGGDVTVTMKNTCTSPVAVRPANFALVLVTSRPTSNAEMGYKDPDDCSFWSCHDSYSGNGGRRECACRKERLDWTAQKLAQDGQGVTSAPDDIMYKVMVAPGGYSAKLTVGKLLLPGTYQLFAYYEDWSRGAAPMSVRRDFDVVEKEEQPQTRPK